MIPKSKPPVTGRLKLKYDAPLSCSASKFNLRRYTVAHTDQFQGEDGERFLFHVGGRGLNSFTSQLNLSRFGHTSPCPPV
jgi:hypothetical protein